MTLLFETFGIVVLAASVRALLRVDMAPSLTTGVTVVALAIGGAAFWLGGYAAIRRLLAEHSSSEVITRAQANAAAGGLFPADEGFLAWADARLPKTARVYMECSGHCPGEWVTYRLSPRVFVSSPSEAQFALFYDVPPSSAAFARGKALTVFAPADTSGDANFVAGQEAIAALHP